MSIVFQTEAHNTGIATIVVSQPTAIGGGALLSTDYLVAKLLIYDNNSATPSAPVGFTKVRDDAVIVNARNMHALVYVKFVGAGAANYTFGNTGSNYNDVSISAWRGVDSTTPFALGGLESIETNGTGPTVASSTGITLSQTSTVIFWGTGYNGNITKPSAFTLITAFEGSGSFFNASYLEFGAGTTGAITGSGPASDAWVVETFALIAAGAVGGINVGGITYVTS